MGIATVTSLMIFLCKQLLPWGDKLTAESLQFFSPIVIWTRPDSRSDIQETVFSAFQEYLAVSHDVLLRIFTLKNILSLDNWDCNGDIQGSQEWVHKKLEADGSVCLSRSLDAWKYSILQRKHIH